jgi:hypothetical protein
MGRGRKREMGQEKCGAVLPAGPNATLRLGYKERERRGGAGSMQTNAHSPPPRCARPATPSPSPSPPRYVNEKVKMKYAAAPPAPAAAAAAVAVAGTAKEKRQRGGRLQILAPRRGARTSPQPQQRRRRRRSVGAKAFEGTRAPRRPWGNPSLEAHAAPA